WRASYQSGRRSPDAGFGREGPEGRVWTHIAAESSRGRPCLRYPFYPAAPRSTPGGPTMNRRSPFALFALALALCSCKGDTEASSSSPSSSSESDEGGGGGGGGFDLPFAKILADSLDKPGPYEEPRHSDDYADGVEHWALFEIDEPLGELESISLFSGATGKPLRGLTDDLRRMATDTKVKGVLLRTTGLELDMATAEELRAAMKDVRASGKPVVCHTEGIANSGYYVLTACDTVALAPLGDVMITGAAATP